MVVGVDTQLMRNSIIKGPADVIVTTHIVNPGAVVRNAKTLLHRGSEQTGLAGSQRVPDQRHQQRIVRQLTFVLVDVLDHFIRVNNGFGFKHNRRSDNLQTAIEGLDQLVCIRLILAIGSHVFPDKGQCVEA